MQCVPVLVSIILSTWLLLVVLVRYETEHARRLALGLFPYTTQQHLLYVSIIALGLWITVASCVVLIANRADYCTDII